MNDRQLLYFVHCKLDAAYGQSILKEYMNHLRAIILSTPSDRTTPSLGALDIHAATLIRAEFKDGWGSTTPKAPDMINSPPHYQILPGVEVYDVRMAILEKVDGVSAQQIDDWSRAWEYLTRMWQKNGVEDAKKARWYLNKLIEKMVK